MSAYTITVTRPQYFKNMPAEPVIVQNVSLQACATVIIDESDGEEITEGKLLEELEKVFTDQSNKTLIIPSFNNTIFTITRQQEKP